MSTAGDVVNAAEIRLCIYCGEELDFPTTGDDHLYVPTLQEIVEDALGEQS